MSTLQFSIKQTNKKKTNRIFAPPQTQPWRHHKIRGRFLNLRQKLQPLMEGGLCHKQEIGWHIIFYFSVPYHIIFISRSLLKIFPLRKQKLIIPGNRSGVDKICTKLATSVFSLLPTLFSPKWLHVKESFQSRSTRNFPESYNNVRRGVKSSLQCQRLCSEMNHLYHSLSIWFSNSSR